MATNVYYTDATPKVLKQSFMNIDVGKTPSNDELYFKRQDVITLALFNRCIAMVSAGMDFSCILCITLWR